MIFSGRAYQFDPTRETRQAIANRIAAKWGVTHSQLFARKRRGGVTEARREIYYEMASAGYSSTQIARFMERDHSSVLAGAKIHEAGLSTDAHGFVPPCDRRVPRQAEVSV